jgi:hypothetical protein
MEKRQLSWKWCTLIFFFACTIAFAGPASDFDFKQDTLGFANSTVWGYEQGKIISHSNPQNKEKKHRYTRHCFVMSRTVVQFHKFARFDPGSTPLSDEELAHRVREVTAREPWQSPDPIEKRVVFPGYHNLREMSEKKELLLKRNIGHGWTAYLRVGNFRMFFLHSHSYQEKQHQLMERAVARGDFFVAYLSDFPILHINHSVLVYKHKSQRAPDGSDHYWAYDPNHPDGPRELQWLPAKRQFEFQKDQEFAGGFARVFQVYSKPLQ